MPVLDHNSAAGRLELPERGSAEHQVEGTSRGNNHLSLVTQKTEEELFEEGAFCDTTLRIVIVSPLPGSLRTLVSALTTRCYDVLLFRNENDPTLSIIQADLIIVDCRTGIPASEKLLAQAEQERHLFLRLVDHATEGSELQHQSSPESNGLSLYWPGPIDQALILIEQLASHNQADTARRDVKAKAEDTLTMKDIVVDLKRMLVHRAEQVINLTKTEFDLLHALLTSGGSVLSRQTIMERIWGDDYFGGSNSVDVHIKSLRHKLGDDPKHPQYIVTVRGVGYRLADS